MEVEGKFLTHLVRSFLQSGFIKALGNGVWALTASGGGLLQYALAVALDLARMGWNQVVDRIRNRAQEGNGMVSTILALLERFGMGSFEGVMRLIGKAFEFLMKLMNMVGNEITSGSKMQSVKQ